MYIGRYENKIDSKGRLSIPADFRRILEENDPKWEPGTNAHLFIVFGDERRDYLEIFSVNDFRDVHRQIQAKDQNSREQVALQRLFAHQVQPAQLDETGRVVLNSYLRTKIGLTDKALVLGNSGTFMIWEPETYSRNDMKGLPPDDNFDESVDPATYLKGKPLDREFG
ncbi:cell division/cell wall cluster transcriptional repressor MraZ [Palleronia sp. LCG004]|uniref:division/cell wall cluster transcriptional repressor MraZ n=1 Tax=Palleronia sp. LCG004 TaxID=3079304 RepID=UPI002941EDAA|nr:cell division/cell wall cluster transcriptional repressor MraZ [Palleronia sp. LCG004]WOI55332.1 cell division/cell wall cluster transcriptional repressor MraZ [Palleronia sp. LCG004]